MWKPQSLDSAAEGALALASHWCCDLRRHGRTAPRGLHRVPSRTGITPPTGKAVVVCRSRSDSFDRRTLGPLEHAAACPSRHDRPSAEATAVPGSRLTVRAIARAVLPVAPRRNTQYF